MPVADVNVALFVILICGQLAAAGALVAVIWALNRWRSGDCGHDDLVAAAVSTPDAFTSVLTAPKTTAILWRCARCAHVEAETIPGRWTLAQVRAWGAGDMPDNWQPPAEPLALPAGSDHG